MRTLSTAAPVREAMPLANRMARLIRLAPDEMAVLRGLQAEIRLVPRGRKLLVEGKSFDEVFVIVSGIAIRYRVLNDGRRQISRLLVPEDIAGYGTWMTGNANFSTVALTDMAVAPIAHARLMQGLESRPRLLAKVVMSFSCDAAIDAERLVDLGRRSALERVAHFLLELLTRLQAVGLADDRSYQMPLTQELISDALGLSVTHVSRVFHRLRSEGLADLAEQRVEITDIAGLMALADFDPGYLQPRLPEEVFERVAAARA